MLLTGSCSKCHEVIKLDIGTMTISEAIQALEKWDTFNCPGHHVELSSPYPYYWNLDTWTLEEGHAMTEKEFEAMLRNQYKEVRETTEMTGLITGFYGGQPETNDGKYWYFYDSPKGKRWYVTYG